MTLLSIGLLVWIAVHLFPSLLPDARAALINRMGEKAYKGVFALAIVVSLVLIVVGWRRADVAAVYTPPLLGSPIIPVLVLVSFVLMAAANAPTNIRRFLRHPMLTGVIVWGVAHLLANGENRSVMLFGSMSLWALASIVSINRREGEWQKPTPIAISKDVVTVVISAVVFAIVLYFHETLFGVPAIPGE